MASQYQYQIKELIKFLASNSSSELLISFVASRNGMLAACTKLQKAVEQRGTGKLGWIEEECGKNSITLDYFLQHLSQIVTLFTSTEESGDYYDILGLVPGAGHDEIKRSYRKLSLRYHPDTATGDDRDAAEKFMQLTRAYHFLLDGADSVEAGVSAAVKGKWQPLRQRDVRPLGRKNLLLWSVGLVIGLLIFSALASNVYNKRAMLAGLKESRGAFVPQATHRSEAKPQPPQQGVTLTSAKLAADKTKNQYSGSIKEEPLEKTEQIEAEMARHPVAGFLHDNEHTEIWRLQVGTHPYLVTVNREKVDLPRKKPTLEKTETSQPALVVKEPTLPEEVAPEQLQVTKAPVSLATSETKEVAEKLEGDDHSAEMAEQYLVAQSALVSDNSAIEALREIDTQLKIDSFFAQYITAYEQRNGTLFSSFFAADAVENGKPFTSMLPVYVDLFAATSQVKMDMTLLAWEAVDNGISIRSRFKVYLLYKNAKEIHGGGAIRFVLENSDDTFRISSMDYEFDN